ncbi:hypothetical protein B0H10DRAFT_2073535 [Mycena sp. CBHHK59/15]|nr:hypothetical protein B0H10DRAFT_2073535 [Mycena sp. CBHHK59/15]
MAIPVLPVDVILSIFKYIGVKEIMKIRQTCKDFLEITRLRSVWQNLLNTEVLQRNIPIPRLSGRNLATFTSTELETCLADALRLRKNWISPSPTPVRRFTFKTVHEPQSQVVSLAFLPGRGHRWLISLVLTVTVNQRMFTLQCWDLHGALFCVARRSLAVFRGFRVNTDPDHAGVLALRSVIGIEILGIDFLASDPDLAFMRLQTLENVDEGLHIFSGSTLLTKFGENRLNLRTIDNPESSAELRNPRYPHKECIDAIIHDDYAVVVRTVTLEFYSLSSFRTASAHQTLEPIAYHVWQWRVDAVEMAYQPSCTTPRGLEPPINILVRYASLFPWPVNALHHYVLPSDGSYLAGKAINLNNTPYLTDPVLIRTFPSPIRLFARWDMVLGSYGTALWIDSHTEYYFDHAVEGQRLAGTLFTSVDAGAEVLALTDQAASATASMVFQVRADDGWVRIAIEEQEGMIAVGTTTAEISIFEYI